MHLFEIKIIEEEIEFGSFDEEEVHGLVCYNTMLPSRDLATDIAFPLYFQKVLDKFIMTKDLSWKDVSYLVQALLLGIDNFPLAPLSNWTDVLLLYFNDGLQRHFSSLDNIKGIGLRALIIYDLSFEISLFAQQVVEFEYTVETHIFEKLRFRQECLFVIGR